MSEGIFANLNELIAIKERVYLNNAYNIKKTTTYDGQYLSNIRGRGMEFAEVRNYQPGDDVRHIHWRVSARTGKTHVKLYEQERDRPIILLVDFNHSMYFGTRIAFKSVVAARLAAHFAWAGLKNGDKVGGFFASPLIHQEFLPMGKEKSVLPMLKSLSDFTMRYSDFQDFNIKHDALNNALIKVKRILKPGAILIIISDLYQSNLDTIKHLRPFAAHNEIFLFHILDKLEISPPQPDHYAISDGMEEMLLDTTSNIINMNYERYLNNRMQKTKNDLRQLKIHYNQVTSETNLVNLLNILSRNKYG